VTQRRVPDSPLSSEINQPLSTELGQTVRVQATVTGPASQLFDNLQLTSNPSRSESEIIALLGGGFVNTLGGATVHWDLPILPARLCLATLGNQTILEMRLA